MTGKGAYRSRDTTCPVEAIDDTSLFHTEDGTHQHPFGLQLGASDGEGSTEADHDAVPSPELSIPFLYQTLAASSK